MTEPNSKIGFLPIRSEIFANPKIVIDAAIKQMTFDIEAWRNDKFSSVTRYAWIYTKIK